MKFKVKPSSIKGTTLVPASKSHTIRAVFIAALSDGVCVIKNPLESSDGRSALSTVKAMGAGVEVINGDWHITGHGGDIIAPAVPVDVGNSGTSARFSLSFASLCDSPITITGDEQTRSRPMGPLLTALSNLGVEIKSAGGKLPATVKGPVMGGETEVNGKTSQYLSSLLIHAPLAKKDCVLKLDGLNEKPYVDMTLAWLDRMGIEYDRDGYDMFKVRGNQKYSAFSATVPGDFSSATFFACMGAIPGNSVTLQGLDMEDTQGDRAIFGYLEAMGAKVSIDREKMEVIVTGDVLKGVKLDLNSTPDALPAMAALSALADGVTELGNVPQARIKETDRISVMAEELGKMGIKCDEKPDALLVHGGKPIGSQVSGHGDHRVVMSLALLGSASEGVTEIETAEAVNITFPTFAKDFMACGGNIVVAE